MLRNELQRSFDVSQVPCHIDLPGRPGHLSKKAAVVFETSGQVKPLRDIGRGFLAMGIGPKTKNVCHSEENLFPAAMRDRHHLAAPVAIELRRQTVWPLCISEQRFILL